METSHEDLNYLKLLSTQYPSIQATIAKIIQLNTQLNLPKGTEHFISDIHGEYEALRHVLKNGSGSIRRRIDELFAETLTEAERRNLATLIYYPEQKLPLILKKVEDKGNWYQVTLRNLIEVCRNVAGKYPRTTVEGFLPQGYAPIIEELLYEQEKIIVRERYYQSIIDNIIATNSAPSFIKALAELIQKLAIARLHILGDVYDRGPGAHLIMDMLMDYHSIDIQWGNHDILWMGAAAGSDACIANVIRICLRYANMETLENGYGINLLPLVSFAIETYGHDDCALFKPSPSGEIELTENEQLIMARMHKAITIIQFKLEGQIIQRRPQYKMGDRLLLDKIDFAKGTIQVDGVTHPLLDQNFPTIDPDQPYVLNEQEKIVLERLRLSFINSNRLQRHVRFLFSKGSMYLKYNGNLLYHGCIPMNPDGTFSAFNIDGQQRVAREFMDGLDRLARQGYFATDEPERKLDGMDTMWYLWSGAQSPIFAKEKMATFERYFITDPATHVEKRNAYYEYRDRKEIAEKILVEFGLDPKSGHIINGHVPVKVKRGESPLKARGKLIVIDGGLSKAYQKQTGIAGYTLVSNSFGLLLAAHQPFESTQKAIEEEVDIESTTQILKPNDVRILVRETDHGLEIKHRVNELTALLEAYRTGLIKES